MSIDRPSEPSPGWHPRPREYAPDSVASEPRYKLDIEDDHPIFEDKPLEEGVLRPVLRQAIERVTGVTVELDEDSLPTRETIAALVESGTNGGVMISRLLSELSHRVWESKQEKVDALEAFHNECERRFDDEKSSRIDAERREVYSKILPFDRPENPAGQRVAEWMKARMGHFDIVFDGKLAAKKWRSGGMGVERYGGSELRELAGIVSSATENEYQEICPGLPRAEAVGIINDPHLERLLEAVQLRSFERPAGTATALPAEKLAEFLQLEHYVESLPSSVGGLRELLTAHARYVHSQLATEAGYHPELRAAFENAVADTSSFPTYEQYRAEQNKPKPIGARILSAVLKLFGG